MDNYISNILSTFDFAIATEKRRHIAGGLLMSVALLFGGMAITVMTTKFNEEEDNHDEW